MSIFFKTVAAALITAVFYLVLSKKDKDISMLLTAAVCCMILAAALTYLEPVIALIHRLQDIANMNNEMLGILLKAVGIGLLSEIIGLVCADIGNAALGKSVQMLTTAVILWLSIPLFSNLLDMVGEILSKA